MNYLSSDYDFYHMRDSYGSDLCHFPDKSLKELVELANNDDNCVAFNTLGFLKYETCPVDDLKWLPGDINPTNGIYIKRKKSITVILNVYRRPQHLKEQFEAILNQTVKPDQIYIWNNGCDWDFSLYKNHEKVTFFDCNRNMGVWSRFLVALNTKTDYICVLDDDTIPGKRWFENCLTTLKKVNGLLGTVGIIFKQGYKYEIEKRVGWPEPNDNIQEVDITGHSWFFKKGLINSFVKNIPDLEICKTSGEDIHFSYILNKKLGFKTYVPPHPKENLDYWGSIPEKAWKYGTDENAISQNIELSKNFDKTFLFYFKKGFETIENTKHFLRNYNQSLMFFLKKINKKEPFALIRLGDGEYNILIDNSLSVNEGWNYKSGSILNKHLIEAINLDYKNVYYGISAPCDSKYVNTYYRNNLKNSSNLTFANILCNSNYIKFKNFIENTDGNIVLIGCSKPDDQYIGRLKIIDYYRISSNLVDKWDEEYKIHFEETQNLARRYKGQLFFISGGPVAKVLIYKMYEANPKNIYLDVGSAIDPYTKGVKTRPYHNNETNFGKHSCFFD